MASALLRRSSLTVALAALATIASPLVGTGSAATFAATGITSTPAPSSSTPPVVEANRPTITATFNADLASGSTMTLVKKGDSTNLCSSFAISGPTVSCTPDVALPLGQTYDAIGHGVAGDGSTADSATFEFVPAYPSYKTSAPIPGGSLQIGDSSHPIQITYNTNNDLDGTKSHITVRNFLDGKPGNPIAGTTTVTVPAGSLPNAVKNVVQFAPATAMSDGAEYEVTAHVEEAGESATNPATADTFFDMFIESAAPSNLAVAENPPVANNVNSSAFHFAGQGAVGQSVHVSVNGTDQTTMTASTASGAATVPTCGQPICSWDVAVDVSGLKDDPSMTWSAHTTDGDNRVTSETPGPSFQKDTTAPHTPTATGALAPGSVDLHVTAPNPDSPTADIDHYTVKVTDSSNPVRQFGPASFAPTGSDGLDAHINVSALNDGTLTITALAVDANGNVSDPPSFPNSPPTVTKNVGNTPDYADSTVTTRGTNLTLPQVDGKTINSPTQVTIIFSQNIKPSWTDSKTDPAHPATHSSTLCVEDKASFNGTNCLNGPTTFPAANVMQTTIGFQLAQTNGYHVYATAWPAAFCTDISAASPPGTNSNCNAFQSDITSPGTGDAFTFTVDDTPPAAPVVNMSSVIDANSIQDVGVSGTAEPGSTINATVRSSGGGSLLVANPGGTKTDNSGRWSFVSNFASLPDGTLSVSVTATDSSGNVGPAGSPTPAPVLQARPSAPQSLTATPADRSASLSWTAPASTGGQSLTSYSLTTKDLSASTAPQTTTVPGNATSTTVTGLTNGHSYQFSLIANNSIGSGPAATTTASPKGNTAMIVRPSARTITYGGFVAVQGTLSYFGVGVANKPVTVTTLFFNGTHGTTYHVTTDQNGMWILAGLSPARNVTYIASFAGDSTFNAASGATGVLVRAVVRTTKVTSANSSHLTAVTLRGYVHPTQSRRHVYIYEVLAHGRLKLIGHTTTTTKSTWTFVHKWARGKHIVVARFFSQNGNVGNWGNRVKFTRT